MFFFLSMMELFLVSSQSFGLRFMQRCTTLITKPLWRVCIDSLLNLIIPACISGFFYVKVIQILRNQEKRADRNRILSISFVFSWLLWVLLWTPKFILGFMQLGFKSDGSSTGRLGNTVLAYLVPFQTNIQILYSQLNPTIFVVRIKQIHDYHKNLWMLLKTILLLEPSGDTESTTSKQQSASQSKEFGYKYIIKSNDSNLLFKVLVVTFATRALFLMATAIVNRMVWNSSGNELEFLSKTSGETKRLGKPIKRTLINVRGLN